MPKLRKFPFARLKARTGTIGGFLFENIDLPRTLFHSIEVPLEPFDALDVSGKKARLETSLVLDFIEFPDPPFRGYRKLVGQTLEFPSNPEDGYIDASIYVCSAHNFVDVSELSFQSFRRGLLEVTMRLAVDFETEGTGYANSDAMDVTVALRPQPVRIADTIVAGAKRRSPRTILRPFVDASILGDVTKKDGRVYVALCE